MNATLNGYCYATVAPSRLMVPDDVKRGEFPLIDAKALATMRERSARPGWEATRWAAVQNIDLGSPWLGNLKFVAVGPDRGVACITTAAPTHWAYYFVGWVDLATGNIVPDLP